MTQSSTQHARSKTVIEVLYALVALGFFGYLVNYYVTTLGGPTLLAYTMVPFTFVLYTLDCLRKDDLYPRLGPTANYLIAAVYIGICVYVSAYMYVEFEAIGTERAGSWDPTDMVLGGAMTLLVMEYARKRHLSLFVLNIVLILYAVYGWIIPGMFNHPGLSWTRILTSMSLEDATGIFSSLPQLALTLIGSFVLVLSVLRAFGCIDSILKGAGLIASRSAYALPQTAVIGSFAVGSVSGSGAANAVTTGSATIPALIRAGMPRPDAAAIETASSLGGQLMPPIMGISAFLMADFLDRSYFDVVARGYVPALVYFISVSVAVYLLSVRYRAVKVPGVLQDRVMAADWANITAFMMVVFGLIVLMAVLFLPPMFAALYTFVGISLLMLGRTAFDVRALRGRARLRAFAAPLVRFVESFAGMTADLTLLLATLGILTSALVNTGVPTKVGFLLVDAAGINIGLMALAAFGFGALLGMGLPPAPTYILTALVIAPHMIKAGMDPWAVHFFAFFLAVWGELTPPTSIVAAVTSKIAEATFLGTLWRAILLCISLFTLMAAMFVHPELVQEPGLSQLFAMGLVLVCTIGLTFALQARFSRRPALDWTVRGVLFGLALVVLFDPSTTLSVLAALGVVVAVGVWVVRHRREEAALDAAAPAPA